MIAVASGGKAAGALARPPVLMRYTRAVGKPMEAGASEGELNSGQ